MSKTAEENAWRGELLQLLSNAHTIGGTAELNFQLVESNYSVRLFFYSIGPV